MYALGKLPAKHDARIPMLVDLLTLPAGPALPTPLWYQLIKMWPMLANDRLGICTIANALHQIQFWTTVNGSGIIPTDDCAISNYSRATGYDPKTGANDNGAYEHDILQFWMRTGLAVSPTSALDRLDGYAVIQPGDLQTLRLAIALFGTVYVGVELPTTAMTEFENGQKWADLTAAIGSLGGHSIPLVNATSSGFFCITWGKIQEMTIDWWLKYGSEAYVPLRLDWVNARNKLAPSGLNFQQLQERIVKLQGVLAYAA